MRRISGQGIADRITDALQGVGPHAWWQNIMHSALASSLAHTMSFHDSKQE